MMEPAQKPAATHFVLDVINAFPRRLRARAVGHPQKNSRDELDEEREGERAAPDITPARSTRNIFEQRLSGQVNDPRAFVEPGNERFHATGIFSAWPA